MLYCVKWFADLGSYIVVALRVDDIHDKRIPILMIFILPFLNGYGGGMARDFCRGVEFSCITLETLSINAVVIVVTLFAIYEFAALYHSLTSFCMYFDEFISTPAFLLAGALSSDYCPIWVGAFLTACGGGIMVGCILGRYKNVLDILSGRISILIEALALQMLGLSTCSMLCVFAFHLLIHLLFHCLALRDMKGIIMCLYHWKKHFPSNTFCHSLLPNLSFVVVFINMKPKKKCFQTYFYNGKYRDQRKDIARFRPILT